jgi:tetratricopeptide (TPR) repeat protein
MRTRIMIIFLSTFPLTWALGVSRLCASDTALQRKILLEKKIALYSQLIDLAPEHPDSFGYYLERIEAFEELEQVSKAKREMEIAAAVAKNEWALDNDSFSQRKNDILRVCNEIINSDPENIYAYLEMARIHLESGQLEEALESCNKAIAVDPLFPDVYELRLLIYEKLNHEKEYEEDYLKLLELGSEYLWK